MPAELDWI